MTKSSLCHSSFQPSLSEAHFGDFPQHLSQSCCKIAITSYIICVYSLNQEPNQKLALLWKLSEMNLKPSTISAGFRCKLPFQNLHQKVSGYLCLVKHINICMYFFWTSGSILHHFSGLIWAYKRKLAGNQRGQGGNVTTRETREWGNSKVRGLGGAP